MLLTSQRAAESKRRFSPRRAPVAIVLGALLGAGWVAIFLCWPAFFTGKLKQAAGLVWVTLIVAGVCWLFGLVGLGIPFWRELHRAGRRGPKDAAVLGAALTFSAAGVLGLLLPTPTTSIVGDRALVLNGQRTLYGWLELLQGSALLAVAGLLVALTVWWVSYPRVKPPPAPPV